MVQEAIKIDKVNGCNFGDAFRYRICNICI